MSLFPLNPGKSGSLLWPNQLLDHYVQKEMMIAGNQMPYGMKTKATNRYWIFSTDVQERWSTISQNYNPPSSWKSTLRLQRNKYYRYIGVDYLWPSQCCLTTTPIIHYRQCWLADGSCIQHLEACRFSIPAVKYFYNLKIYPRSF